MYNTAILYVIERSVSSASNEAHVADVSTATLLATQCITGTCAENNAAGLDAGSQEDMLLAWAHAGSDAAHFAARTFNCRALQDWIAAFAPPGKRAKLAKLLPR